MLSDETTETVECVLLLFLPGDLSSLVLSYGTSWPKLSVKFQTLQMDLTIRPYVPPTLTEDLWLQSYLSIRLCDPESIWFRTITPPQVDRVARIHWNSADEAALLVTVTKRVYLFTQDKLRELSDLTQKPWVDTKSLLGFNKTWPDELPQFCFWGPLTRHDETVWWIDGTYMQC